MSDDLDRLDKLAEAETLATIAIARSLHGGAADHEDFDYYRKHVEIALEAAGVREILVERDAALASEAKVRELHRKYTYYGHEDSCENISEEHREERHRESDAVGEFYCEDMPVSTHCEACRDEYGDERLEWPCPTIRALDADGKEMNE